MKNLSEAQRQKINGLVKKLDSEKVKYDFTELFEFLIGHEKDLNRYERAIGAIEDKCAHLNIRAGQNNLNREVRDNYDIIYKGLKELKGKQMKFNSMIKEYEGDSTGN